MSLGDRRDPVSTSHSTQATDGRSLPVLAQQAQHLGLSISEDQYAQFSRYLQLLSEWNERAGLTAVTDPDEVQRRHFAEALALLSVLRDAGVLAPGVAATVVDIGSGAGFPGLAMRIAEPALHLTLIESHGRRCDFLRTVAGELGLRDVTVVQQRAEDAGRDPALREHFDLAVARALAALPVLLEYAVPLLRPGGVLACPKGSALDAEIAAAQAGATAALGVTLDSPLPLPAATDAPPQRVILARRTGPLPERYPRRTGIPAKRPLGGTAGAPPAPATGD